MRKPTRRDRALIRSSSRLRLRASVGARRLRSTTQSIEPPRVGRLGLARLPDGLGIEAGPHQIEGHRIDQAQQVEVDEAVVHRA